MLFWVLISTSWSRLGFSQSSSQSLVTLKCTIFLTCVQVSQACGHKRDSPHSGLSANVLRDCGPALFPRVCSSVLSDFGFLSYCDQLREIRSSVLVTNSPWPTLASVLLDSFPSSSFLGLLSLCQSHPSSCRNGCFHWPLLLEADLIS